MVTTKGCHPFRCTLEKWSSLSHSQPKYFAAVNGSENITDLTKWHNLWLNFSISIVSVLISDLFHELWPSVSSKMLFHTVHTCPSSNNGYRTALGTVWQKSLANLGDVPWKGWHSEISKQLRAQRHFPFSDNQLNDMSFESFFLSRVHCSPRELNFEEFQPCTLPWPSDKYFFLKHLLKCRGYLGF